MNIISFFKNLFRIGNIGTILFFLMNAYLIIAIFSGGNPGKIVFIAFLYIISVLITISPIGEFILSTYVGAKIIRNPDIRDKIAPLVQNVYDKAREKTPSLPRNIILKYTEDEVSNAFALGRKTICVTKGLIESLPEDEIEGVIAHEFGHLALHHTVIQLAIGSGNIIISLFLMFLSFLKRIAEIIGSLAGCFGRILILKILCAAVGWVCSFLIWLWTKICMLFFMWSSRANEYDADKYAFEIGYGNELATALEDVAVAVPSRSFFEAIYSSHPDTSDRVGRLKEMERRGC